MKFNRVSATNALVPLSRVCNELPFGLVFELTCLS